MPPRVTNSTLDPQRPSSPPPSWAWGGKPKLRLENTVSKSVSRELGSGLVQMTFRSQIPSLGMMKVARPSRSVRRVSSGAAYEVTDVLQRYRNAPAIRPHCRCHFPSGNLPYQSEPENRHQLDRWIREPSECLRKKGLGP